jgi:hypothetical protein
MAEPSAGAYAVLRRSDVELDLSTVARILAPILGCVRADLQGQLAKRPGILVSGLSRHVASQAAHALEQAGVGVRVLPQSDVVIPPPMVEVRRGKVLPQGFQFEDSRAPRLAPWKEIVYFDAVQIQTAKNVIAYDREWDTSGEEGVTFRDVAYLRLETGWQELLDVVCYEPWVHLRIDKNDFRYSETGLPLHANAMKNFLALLIAFKTRCDALAEGPGVRLLFDGRTETRQRMPNLNTYENLFQCRLTLRFRAV